MNKKAQTEDIFADLIPSAIIIAVGILVLYYFSYSFNGEVDENKITASMMEDRESFSIQGMLEHKTEINGKKYKLVELIDDYGTKEKGFIEGIEHKIALKEAANDYLKRIDPKIRTCFKITLKTSIHDDLYLADMCELKTLAEPKMEVMTIPLSNGGYAKIKLEYGKQESII